MNGDLRIYPELGYVVVSLSNLDPPAASVLVRLLHAPHARPIADRRSRLNTLLNSRRSRAPARSVIPAVSGHPADLGDRDVEHEFVPGWLAMAVRRSRAPSRRSGPTSDALPGAPWVTG